MRGVKGKLPCAVSTCDRISFGKGYCRTHYRRFQVGADLEAPIKSPGLNPYCKLPDCRRQHYGHGFCSLHFQRWKDGRAMDAPVRAQSIHDPIVPGTAHARATREFGPAKLHECIECGGPAQDWAYDGTDPTQLYGRDSKHQSKTFYSRYPEFYMPMCKSCHLARDSKLRAIEVEEYRTLKTESGLSYDEIRAAVGL